MLGYQNNYKNPNNNQKNIGSPGGDILPEIVVGIIVLGHGLNPDHQTLSHSCLHDTTLQSRVFGKSYDLDCHQLI
jgi:hypothetical protein